MSTTEQPEPRIPWAAATAADLNEVDVNHLVEGVRSADQHELASLFAQAAAAQPDTPAERIYALIGTVMGMHFKPQEHEPFGPMAVFDGRRSPIPSDFAPFIDLLQEIAERLRHPLMQAWMGDVCWLNDLKRGRIAKVAIEKYLQVVTDVRNGNLAFPHDTLGRGELSHDSRDLLTRALAIARRTGWNSDQAQMARDACSALRAAAMASGDLVPILWFSQLDQQHRITDPAVLAESLKTLLETHSPGTPVDDHTAVALWKLTARAFNAAGNEIERDGCLVAASQVHMRSADTAVSKLLAITHISDAIQVIHGIRGQDALRDKYREKLAQAQLNVGDEMTTFSQSLDLEEIAAKHEMRFQDLTLSESLFTLVALTQSPQPEKLIEDAREAIREYPLSAFFPAMHMDHEGKVVHRTAFDDGDGADSPAIRQKISQAERLRRHIAVGGAIEPALNVIAARHTIFEKDLLRLTSLSPFVPEGQAVTFARGLTSFLQHDNVSACYILFPLLENALRHVLKLAGHNVAKFDDATQTEQDRTISSLFDQMRPELDKVFGPAITTDIDNLFLSKEGPHLRHSLAHGQMFDGEPYEPDAIYGCWLIFRLCLMPLWRSREQFSF